jgi:hypothetical protein
MLDVRKLTYEAIEYKKEGKEITVNENLGTILGISKEVYEVASSYPKCLDVRHFIRFLIAPTCCY